MKEQQKMLDFYDRYRTELIKPSQISSYFTVLTPDYLVNQASTEIAGTDRYYREEHIRTEARNYRNTIVRYLAAKGAFGLKFFTRMKPEEMRDNWDEYSNEVKDKYTDVSKYTPIPTDDVPRFMYTSGIVIPFELGIILLLNILLFVWGTWQFIHSNLLVKE
jgi:hypothetical protein